MTASAGAVQPDERVLTRIRAGYFLYFLGLGVFLPYFSPYLLAQGFGPEQVGLLLAVVMGAKVVGPPLLGWVVDHSHRPVHWLRTAITLAVLAFASLQALALTGKHGPEALLGWIVLLALFGLAWHALLPQLDVLALRGLGDQRHRYTALRAWGSIGFIVAAVLMGWMLGGLGAGASSTEQAQLGRVPWLLLFALVLLAILLFRLTEVDHVIETTEGPAPSLGQRLWRWPIWGFLVAHFLINLAHGVYYAFFSIHLAEHGYHGVVIGLLWALGVLAEIVLFLLLPRLMHLLRAGPLLLVAIGLMTVRWLMIGWLVDDLTWLLLAQVLHAASFGLTHAIGIQVINHHFPGRLQARGQAVLSGFSYGGGAAMGLYLAGWLWQHFDPQVAFGCMALVSLLAGVVLLPSLPVVVWARSAASIMPATSKGEGGR